MQLINKKAEPEKFIKWKKANPAATFDSLGRKDSLKQELKRSLLSEQHFICCYCENQIDLDISHIEHLQPQHKFPQQQLAYANLMASCDADNRKAHCGHKKSKNLLPISPLGPNDPAPNFIYSADGHIYPHPKANRLADKTISILGLNASRLVNMRKAAISGLLTQPIEHLAQVTIACTRPDASNKLPPYSSAILYQLRSVVVAA